VSSGGRGALLSSGTRTASTAKDGLSIVRLEPPYALEERKQSGESVEDDVRKGGIRKCCGASFPVFFSTPGPD
jgi:hypothetical protein